MVSEVEDLFDDDYKDLDEEPNVGYEMEPGDMESTIEGIVVEAPDPEEDEDDG